MKNYLKDRNLSFNTVEIYYYWINVFLTSSKKNKTLNENIFSFKNHCKKTYSVQTQKIIISALKHYCKKMDIKINLKVPVSNRVLKGSIISEFEYQRVLDEYISSDYYVSVRNKELFKILWNTGLRISEALNLKWKHITDNYIIVKGKNNIERKVYFPKNLFYELSLIKNSPYIFSTSAKKQISYSTVVLFFLDVKKILNRQEICAHSLRHSYATRLLNCGISIIYIQKLLGHQNIETTLQYLHFNDQDIVKKLEELVWFNKHSTTN